MSNDGKKGSKAKILAFLLANKGRVITAREIQEASGWVAEWGRRVRELRDEEGYQILSHKDRADLKPGEYLLETDKRRPAFARGISKETRAIVLERNGFTCQSCGMAAGDPDPYNPGRYPAHDGPYHRQIERGKRRAVKSKSDMH